MRCPSLSELPPPPPGKTGWPWTEESLRSPESSDAASRPRITVVTPSFNQGKFIEETIRSILLQGYPDLEYFVLDGGSSDNSVEIIRKYEKWITFWVSEPDGGQSAAINRGLRMGSGLHATWICSDDMLCQNALTNHFLSNGLAEGVIYSGECIHVDEVGTTLFTHTGRVHSFEELLQIRAVWCTQGWIDQPAVIFPLELALRGGGLNEDRHFSMDYELWGRLFLVGAKIQYTGVPFGIFRWQREQKSQDNTTTMDSMLDAADDLVAQADFLSAEAKRETLDELRSYRQAYPKVAWKQSGRLARMGVPRSIVQPMRNLKRTVAKSINSLLGSAEGAK